MGLGFKRVDEIFRLYELISHTIKNDSCTEYCFEDRVINVRQKNVATRVKPLINGGVGGYIYVQHLKEYDKHPKKTKMGHIPIGDMTEEELKNTIKKVIMEYR
jgi:glutamate synthase domain-containing protein 3